MIKKTITLFFLFSSLVIFSQKIQFVSAHNGLIIRTSPNKESERIGKLEYGVSIYILEETSIKLSVEDGGNIINGQWVEIQEPKDKQKGFVFSGYLTPNVINKGDETENYYLTKIDSITKQKYWENITNSIKQEPSSIYLRNKKHEDLFEFSISEFESYDDTTLISRDVKNLLNITKIIIVEITYSACCSSTDKYYYLVGLNNNLIELPEIGNTHCDGPEPTYEYIFPNDIQGKKDKIIYAKISSDEENNKVEILKTYSWNGSEFKLEE